jgi:hypothetical protein
MSIIGIILIIGASILISLGWLTPLMEKVAHPIILLSEDWIFNIFHGGLMILIVFPWGSFFIVSIFMFYILSASHITGIVTCYTKLGIFMENMIKYGKKLEMNDQVESGIFMNNKFKYGTEMEQKEIDDILTSFSESRNRLMFSCEFFSDILLSFHIICELMIISGIYNVQQRVRFGIDDHYSAMVQDAFYLITGSVGKIISCWAPVSVSNKGKLFAEEATRVAYLYKQYNLSNLYDNMLVMFDRLPYTYTIYGIPITPITIAIEIYGFLLLIIISVICTQFK